MFEQTKFNIPTVDTERFCFYFVTLYVVLNMSVDFTFSKCLIQYKVASPSNYGWTQT